jgi:YhcH/YjgK/YiaL family protein
MICAPYKELSVPKDLGSPNWDKALAWLKSDSWKNLPDGKTEIDGSKVFVLRSSRTSKLLADCRYESHRLYADIQMAIEGSALILVCVRNGLNITEPYSAEKDVDFLEGEPDPVHRAALAFPLATILFPWDVHMPDLALDKPGKLEKITMKVAL